MRLQKLAPWNWFKKEEEHHGSTLPVRREHATARAASPMRSVHDELDRVFDTFLQGFSFPQLAFGGDLATALPSPLLKPSLNLSASEKEYSITIELPGVDPENVEITLEDRTLVIRGEKSHEQEENKTNYYRVERSYGSFQRMLSLPADANLEAIDARFDKGVLHITLARKPATSSNSESIEIRHG